MTSYLLILALLLGLAPAFIAHGKGRNFLFWWIYGVLLGPIALIHAIMLRGGHRAALEAAPSARETASDSPWPLLLRVAASVAILIVAVAAYRFIMPPDSVESTPGRDIAVSSDRTPPGPPTAIGSAVGDIGPSAPSTSNVPAAESPSTPASEPTVRVTIRRDLAERIDDARNAPAGAEPDARLSRDFATAPDRTAPPPPAAPAPPAAQQLERTLPLDPTTAEDRDSPPKAGHAPVKDVDMLAARTAPPERVIPTGPPHAKPANIAPTQAPPAKSAKRTDPSDATTRTAAVPQQKPDRPDEPSLSDVTAMGEMVLAVQRALTERGYDPGPANGLAGRQTETAIRKFQADRHLNPTGVIDYDLLEALNIAGPRTYTFQSPPGIAPGR